MKKHVKERRAKNLELGKREAAARCAHCRQPLPKMFIEAGIRFCDEGCRLGDEAWNTAREARR